MGNIMDKLQKQANRTKDQEVEHERISNKMQQEDFLLKQIDEFREKAKRLQNVLTAKENKAEELQGVLEKREERAKQLKNELDTQQKEANLLVKGVQKQIAELVAKIDRKSVV